MSEDSGQPPPNPYGAPPPPPPEPGGQVQGGSTPHQPPPYGQPYGQQPHGYAPPSGDRRPGTVTAAAIITWVLSGLCMLAFLFGALALVIAKDDVIAEIEQQSTANGQVLPEDLDPVFGVIVALVLLFAVWCLVSIVLAVFAYRGSNVARILLVVSASMAALLSLVAITGGVSAITLIGAVAVIVLLFTGGANQWYATR